MAPSVTQDSPVLQICRVGFDGFIGPREHSGEEFGGARQEKKPLQAALPEAAHVFLSHLLPKARKRKQQQQREGEGEGR